MATTEEEYKKQVAGADSPQQTDDYFALARDQEYAQMLDKEIQLENSKAQAMKYTQNQINAQGMGGTGYGSSINAGIQSQYLNQVNKAKEDYNAGIKEINAQENQQIQAQANDRFESVTTLINDASDQETVDKMLTEYGYGTINEETGEFVFNETKPEGMSDDDWIQLKYIYENSKNNISGGGTGGTVYTDINSLYEAPTTAGNGKTRPFGEQYKEEVATAFDHASKGELKKGDVVMLDNTKKKDGMGNRAYLMWTGNGFKIITEDVYNNSKGTKHKAIWESGDKSTWE